MQWVAQALGELKTWPVSCHVMVPSAPRSPTNFLPWGVWGERGGPLSPIPVPDPVSPGLTR